MANIKIDISDIEQYCEKIIGTSKWLEITQSRVTKFAEATGGFQWVHLDEERAKVELTSGKTIIQNYLLLSLVPQLFDDVVDITGLKFGLNKGANNIKFRDPISTGSKVRIQLSLSKLQEMDQGGLMATFPVIMECDGSEKPVFTMELQLFLMAA